MRVYHYLPAKWGIQDIEQRCLKVATFEDLNDPFELMCYALPTEHFQRDFRRVKDELAKRIGLLCFSREWNNPVLWGHYGDRHRGMCLGFDVMDPPQGCIEVSYTTKRLPLGPLNEEFARRLISTKYAGWSYEKEIRIFMELDRTATPALTMPSSGQDMFSVRLSLVLCARVVRRFVTLRKTSSAM